MLTKELKPKAEQIAEQLKPLFYRAYELGRIYDNTRKRQRKAERVAHSWNHPAEGLDWQYKEDGGIMKEEREEVRALYSKDKRAWSERTDQEWIKAHKAATAHTCARINFINYLNYFAEYLADLIRPNWREFVERQGLATLSETINKLNPRKGDHTAGDCSAFVYLRGGELMTDHENPDNWARLEVCIYTGWACGISGECLKIYQKNPAEVWHSAEARPLVTPKQYERAAAKIKNYITKAETVRKECREFAQSCGLLGFVEIISNIEKGR